MELNDLLKFAKEHVENFDDTHKDERYRTARQFAADEVGDFLSFIAKRIDPRIIEANKEIADKRKELNDSILHLQDLEGEIAL